MERNPPLEETQRKAQVGQLVAQAATFVRQQQYNQAIADYTRAIELDPRNAMAYNNRGHIYSNLGQHNQAIADYTHAIELSSLPNEVSMGHSNRAFSYARLGRDDQAIADYTRAIELFPQNAVAYFNRAYTYARKGLQDQARRDLQNACNLGDGDGCRALQGQ